MIMNRSPLVLVVDDEAHILHVVSLKLRNAGYQVMTAENGEEALAIALSHRPKLVITDYQMPIMTGLELAIQMKHHDATDDVPLIMLTARGFSLGNERLDQTNIVTVLSKPFSPREVLGKVQQLLDTTTEESMDGAMVRSSMRPGAPGSSEIV